MINNYLKNKILLLIGVILISNNIIALTGNEIVTNANQYLTWRWYCNDWNAREIKDANGNIIKSNKDTDPNNNILEYPFYSQGAKYKDVNGVPQTSDGYHTGVAYGWGLTDTLINYNEKLTWRSPEFLVGNYTDKVNIQIYAGIDCSGFLARSAGFPVLKVNPNNLEFGKFYLLHPTTSDFIKNIFTDEISWGEITKGDILIREYYEEDTNNDGKISNNEKHDGHIGIAINSPNGTVKNSTVGAIDASSNEAKHNGVKYPPIVAT